MKYFYRQKILLASLIYLLFTALSFAKTLDDILQEYSKKNALSKKTIDENKGHLVLFTRDKLESMHAKTLKDVFKATPIAYYHENRYGLPDPLTSGAFEPYRSNFIRLYVDGVEITQGLAGSGLMLYGDININFVDHIEFYYMTPSFETSVEPAYLTIFLYSKDPSRDGGNKVNISLGSRGYSSQSVSTGEKREDFSYMLSLSHTNDKREKIDNGTSHPLSRDFERTQLFSYVKSEDHTFHLQVLKKDTDSLAGLSYDATPLVSKIDYLNIHMDYGIDFSEHLSALFSYEWFKSNHRQEDDMPLSTVGQIFANRFYATIKNSTYTAEITYKKEIDSNRIIAGLKSRHKKFDSLSVDGYGKIPIGLDAETVTSLFFQDQYSLAEHQLLTLGIEYSNVSRSAKTEDDNIWQLRLGYIFTNENWTYKTYLFRSMFAVDPFIGHIIDPKLKHINPQVSLGVTQELSYKDKNSFTRLFFHYMRDENSLVHNENSLVHNNVSVTGVNTKYFTSIINYDYSFSIDNKVNIQIYYAHYKDIFDFDKLENFGGYLSFSNSYNNFDFYNGVVWHRNSVDWKNYFDLTSSISWNVSENISLTLKGQNILDKAKKTRMFRVDPTTGNFLDPLNISPIDRRLMLELRYTF